MRTLFSDLQAPSEATGLDAPNGPTNASIAAALDELARRLADRGANPHRVAAYHTAADTVRHAARPLTDLLREDGLEALQALPGVGESIASRIAGYVETGRLHLLRRITDEFVPEDVFGRIAGVGPALARRIYDELGITTIEELEMAAHDGRLRRVEGFGRGRVQVLRDQLAGLLARRGRRRALAVQEPPSPAAPPVALLLDVDREYVRRSQEGTLMRIAPRRFNPDGEAWLPVLQTTRDGWRVRALYSNTARAHRLGTTEDWVVLYTVPPGGSPEASFTVVTETRGDLEGLRVVRGREAECRTHYRSRTVQAA